MCYILFCISIQARLFLLTHLCPKVGTFSIVHCAYPTTLSGMIGAMLSALVA